MGRYAGGLVVIAPSVSGFAAATFPTSGEGSAAAGRGGRGRLSAARTAPKNVGRDDLGPPCSSPQHWRAESSRPTGDRTALPGIAKPGALRQRMGVNDHVLGRNGRGGAEGQTCYL